LNLTQKNKVFVFIDEPELSLSVDWQRMFLVDILDSASCDGLIATTHSPFVFENELENFVHGINEFCTRG
jgi:predicted ATP-dependent endonuclease of OLD family